MNTSSLTAGTARQSQATALSAQARRLHERLALRAGTRSSRGPVGRSERRTHDAVYQRRQTAQLATRARDDQFRLVALGTPLA